MKITNAENPTGYQCVWSNLSEHPKCPHGPTLLFGRYADGDYKQFYACSACRDRKLCTFYLDHGTKPTKQQKQAWELETKKILPRYDHQKMFIRLNEMLAENPSKRMYCHDCARLSFISEKHKHKDHNISENLTDHQMSHPTEILKPLDNPKKEAQYLFSKKSTEHITDMLVKLGAKNILCIGAPRIHEYITNTLEDKMSSLLLDFDGRFHNFFGPLNFCWYNFFNHHFFNDDSKNVFKDFITQNGGKNIYIVCDPPFGGRVEPMSQTLKTIYDLHKKWNKIDSDTDELKTMFIFPYFMEPTLKEKSNPSGITGGLKDLKMSDYKVEYENHPLFAKSQDRKIGSPVRIFTDINLDLLELPESEGYKKCKKCKKWTSKENKHCKKCKECTSKDGRRYKHCNICERCVKPTWKHCTKCNRCNLEIHNCGEAPKITGQCHKCNEFGHIEKFCSKKDENISISNPKNGSNSLKGKKRQNQEKNEVPSAKKAKIENANKKSKMAKNESLEKAEPISLKKKNIKSKELVKFNSKPKSKKPKLEVVTSPVKKKKLLENGVQKKRVVKNVEVGSETERKNIQKLKTKISLKKKEQNVVEKKLIKLEKSQTVNLDSAITKKKKKVNHKIQKVDPENIKVTNGKITKKTNTKAKKI